MQLLQDAVTEVRVLRGEMELARRVPLTLLIADAELREALDGHQRALGELAGATVETLTERPRGAATLVVRGQEVVIPRWRGL